jgi:hypothetical protein
MTQRALQYSQKRLNRKLVRSVPWIGGLIALAALAAAIRRKGPVGGTVDTALDLVPFVGGVKNMAEAVTGREFIRPKRELARG